NGAAHDNGPFVTHGRREAVDELGVLVDRSRWLPVNGIGSRVARQVDGDRSQTASGEKRQKVVIFAGIRPRRMHADDRCPGPHLVEKSPRPADRNVVTSDLFERFHLASGGYFALRATHSARW